MNAKQITKYLRDHISQSSDRCLTPRSGILCLSKKMEIPKRCSLMPREPALEVDWEISENFINRLEFAMALNPSAHDGAIIAGWNKSKKSYTVLGWSFRLFPKYQPSACHINRGSAFHSSLAMSGEKGFDAVIFWTGQQVNLFVRGELIEEDNFE